MNAIPTNDLTLDTFLPHVKTKFQLRADSVNTVVMELAQASRVGGAHTTTPNKNGMVQDTFSLLFDGPENPLLPQRSYPFEHEKIGRFDLFIVPVEKIPGGIRYEVIFNRLVKA